MAPLCMTESEENFFEIQFQKIYCGQNWSVMELKLYSLGIFIFFSIFKKNQRLRWSYHLFFSLQELFVWSENNSS